ncbi:hypothetical protein E2P81_ATG08946 [Venturia nashicola]|uniref:Uncharacterized protein n=1 Tax=Venturia nashicola TaxID=86259 RepID=A0A4Z1NSC9_9PEZI|nr:hypothetical protein E6O75_ATG09145 [Venturia nashicola]TLD23602.1 hypothetical protein E2P81_ATG08946 [Venturia nashicola]
MTPPDIEQETYTEPQTETDPETDSEVQTPMSDALARSVANRPGSRFIVRWDDPKLIWVFYMFRKKLQEMGIDCRAALDAAVKEAIDPRCTGDAIVQQLAKRIKKNGQEPAATESPSNKRTHAPMTPTPSKTAGSKAKSAATKPPKASFATPVATPRRTKAMAKASTGTAKGADSVSTPKSAKSKRKPATPITSSRVNDDSDSEYMESFEKAKSKRVRGAGSKGKSSRKKSKKQFSDSESDSEYDLVDTPSKKTTNKSKVPDPVMKSSPTTVATQPEPARKNLSAADETVQTIKAFERPGLEDKKGGESPIVKEPQSPEHDGYEHLSRQDSKYNSPPSSNGYIGNFLNDFPSYGVFSGGQALDNGSFGGLLHGGSQSSLYQDQFGGSNIGMSHSGLSEYPDFRPLTHSSIQGYRIPESLHSFGSHIHGDLANSNANHSSSSLDPYRHQSFSTTTSGDVSGFPDLMSGPEQGNFFAAASENFDLDGNYGLPEPNYKFGEF